MANYDKYSAITEGLGNIGKGLLGYLQNQQEREKQQGLLNQKTKEDDIIRQATQGKIAKRDATGLLIGLEDDPVFKEKQRQEEIQKAALEGKVINPDGSYGGYSPTRFEQELQLAEARRNPLDTQLKELNLRKAAKEAQTPGTEGERKASGFARRIEQSEDVFNKLATEGYNRADPKESVKGLLGGFLPEGMKGKLGEQEQAERNFINSVLRRESGAAISPGEFTNAEQQYFPRFGDSPEVLKQKALNRRQVLENIKTEAGPAVVPRVMGTPQGNMPLSPQEWLKQRRGQR